MYIQGILWACSISLFIFLIVHRKKVPPTNLFWVLRGLYLSAIILLLASLAEFFVPSLALVKAVETDVNIVLWILRQIVYLLSFVSPFEEVLFRGLLWGYLIRFGWKEDRVFWFQAILFWLLHFTRFFYIVTFFISVPLSIYTVSILVRKSKQLFPAIIAHTVLDAMAPVMLYVYSQL